MNKFIDKNPFFIAEISANHNGSFEYAKKLIKLAKKYGANAIKLQTYTPDMMTLKNFNFKIKHGLWKNSNLWDLYKKAHTPLEWHHKLFLFAKKNKIKIFSTPFSVEALNFLENLNCPAYKIASFEMNDLNLIKEVAKTKKPMIVSTGLSNLKEIEETVSIIKKNGCKDLTLLYCVSNYPSKYEDFNLKNISLLKKKFKCRIGFSDHSTDNRISSLAMALGAEVFEKHIALNKEKTPDIEFSAVNKDIYLYKKNLDETKKIISNENFYRSKNEMTNLIFRRSIYAIKNIKKGDIFDGTNIKTFRPYVGISAKYFLEIIGKKSPINLKKNTVLPKKIIKKIK